MAKHRARLFMNGRSQAVRLPKEFRFEGDEVEIRRVGDGVVLRPVGPDWESFFAEESAFDDSWLDHREDKPPQEREPF
ncbi:MAG: type II toxin-antitoxin system VapB family antitoxin [Pseudohongiellaceae bacterium]